MATLLNDEAEESLAVLDYIMIAGYFVLVIAVGLGASCQAKTSTAQGYFLAGRSMHWIPIGASTYATNIGATMFIGLAGSAAASGIAVVMFEWHAMFMLVLLGWLFMPVYLASGCYSMPQYLRLRFGGRRIRTWIALLNVLLTIISGIASQIYAGSLFITQIFNWNLYASVVFILVITCIYTVIGGLTAVIWTDTIQTVILVVGSIALAIISMVEVGGFNSMRNQYMWSASNETFLDVSLYGNRTCGLPDPDAFHIFRDAKDGAYPWPGMIGGLTILALNAWCTDQTCVQRSLSARNISHAKAGTLMAAYLKFFPFFFFIIPGMISRVLYPEEVACADPVTCMEVCDNPSGCTNIAYPLLVLRILPTGVRGLMLAALLAALMSSLTSIFNSSSTLFTMDLWRQIHPRAKEAELMVVGRLWTIFLALVSLAWLPILLQVQGSEFWDYSQAIGSYILPPLVMVFLFAVFWTRTTEQGAFWSLVVGLGVGAIRMGLEWSIAPPDCGSGLENEQFNVVKNVHYLHFAIILGVICSVVIVGGSIVTKPRPPEKLRRMTFWTRRDPQLPDLSDDEFDFEDDDDEERTEETVNVEVKSGVLKNFALKWLCGVDHTSTKPPRMSKAEMLELQEKATNIEEDPYWKRVLDINMIICVAFTVFLHAFWA